MNESMEETIAAVHDMRHRSLTCAVCWSGQIYSLSEDLVRFDKLFLNVVLSIAGQLRYRRIVPMLVRGKTGCFLRYGLEACYRIKSGPRAGRVVYASDLYTQEEFVVAGLSKAVEIGRSSGLFNPMREGDVRVSKLLSGMRDGLRKADIKDALPVFYLTVAEGQSPPALRQTKEAVQFLESFPAYQKQQSIADNVLALKPEICRKFAKDREGYPFRFFEGRGVVAALCEDLGTWFEVPSLTFDSSYLEIGEAT